MSWNVSVSMTCRFWNCKWVFQFVVFVIWKSNTSSCGMHMCVFVSFLLVSSSSSKLENTPIDIIPDFFTRHLTMVAHDQHHHHKLWFTITITTTILLFHYLTMVTPDWSESSNGKTATKQGGLFGAFHSYSLMNSLYLHVRPNKTKIHLCEVLPSDTALSASSQDEHPK